MADDPVEQGDGGGVDYSTSGMCLNPPKTPPIPLPTSRRHFAMSRWLIILGVVLIAVGLLWPVLQKLGLGRLPGDIVLERENFRFYFPIAASLIISIVLSLILWLLNR
jgi:hypothetical protein